MDRTFNITSSSFLSQSGRPKPYKIKGDRRHAISILWHVGPSETDHMGLDHCEVNKVYCFNILIVMTGNHTRLKLLNIIKKIK